MKVKNKDKKLRIKVKVKLKVKEDDEGIFEENENYPNDGDEEIHQVQYENKEVESEKMGRKILRG